MFKSRLLTPLLFGSITVVAALLPVSSAFAACSDCPWLFVRCMSHADTPEQEHECEDARAMCEETFCTNPIATPFTDLLRPIVENPLPRPIQIAQAQTPPAERSAQ
ncbi:hypothetical protein AZ78_3680 [Lysobacter capsici AZ78]|uniref:Secreted protein n=1 Tax=Lysobacter capsici AZ78 TaxID=1444315 RepID=A0A125MNC5_9GAMM|nr:hypothetical protein [Lysobacter capsici]KWS06126.1 hypothetical protein AZ78_3680 [Lysobacter capsici AZ78]WND80026.1 hypothetical protein RJ610_22535 [Lysobacter capsici]WND85222.1 hypothetical protein RJ609_22550 [Lysobacter capsici]